MAGILEGIRVIDTGHFVAVPSGAAVPGEWGADALKVEPLSGERQRGVMALSHAPVNWRFEVHNRNKRSIALDLKADRGRDTFYALVRNPTCSCPTTSWPPLRGPDRTALP